MRQRVLWILGLCAGVGIGSLWGQEQGRRPPVDPSIIDRLNIQPALRAADGVLGVRTALWSESNSEATFAWFRDKDAVLDWYLDAEHLDAVDAVLSRPLERSEEPLAHIADDSGPLLVIFYIAADRKATELPEGLTLPLSALSMEIYQPLAGGVSLLGRFTPEKVDIPHHQWLMGGPSTERENDDG